LEGFGVVDSAMFEVAKRGSITAMIFWLKAKAGWRDSDPFGPGFSVNVNTGQGDTIQAERGAGRAAPGAAQAADGGRAQALSEPVAGGRGAPAGAGRQGQAAAHRDDGAAGAGNARGRE
jgi:hypothetical protein